MTLSQNSKTSVADCKIVQVPKIEDRRGNLSFIEGDEHIPFAIARTYWIYDVPGGQKRGGHAYRKLEEFIVAISGSFDVVVDDGKQQKDFLPQPLLLRALHPQPDLADPGELLHQLPRHGPRLPALRRGGLPAGLPVVFEGQGMKPTTVYDCSILELPKIENPAGSITPINAGVDVPFEIARVYYLYDVPGGATRGGHAHKELEQLIVAASGSFDVILDDGANQRTVHLNRPYLGLLMPRMIWRELVNFSSGGICLVLASLKFDPSDYIRDYQQFVALKTGNRA